MVKKGFISEILDFNKFKILFKIISYKFSHFFSITPPLPMNLTVSLDYKCNSRCMTCNIWKKNCNPLSVEEFDRIFKNLGKGVLWVTFSGGEPFLRKDLADICTNFYHNCGPSFINIPTNGILYKIIPKTVEKIARECFPAEIIVNISLDQWGDEHDRIRGVPGNFQKAMNTYNALKSLNISNLTTGIHTVISKYNLKDFYEFYPKLIGLNPDSYIVEIAEEREELDTVGSGITPAVKDYSRLVDFLIKELENGAYKKTSPLTQAFRRVYYELSRDTLLNERQIIPCYSGIISAHIYPDGSLYPCCIMGDSFGNLRDADYDFYELWSGKDAEKIRLSIKKGACFCPLANAAYTSIMCHPLMALKVMAYYLKFSFKKESCR